jgi:4-hydroxy-3-methylbut-2-enyl diphosphate reductase
VLIGHAGHPEVEGTMGQYDQSAGGRMYLVENCQDARRLEVRHPDRLSYVTQTTLSMDDTAQVIDALRARFPLIEGPRKDDICYATQNRQDAVRELAANVDCIVVVGSPNSSNSNRLRELAEKQGVPGYLVDSPEQIQAGWLEGRRRVGVTAGASAPEILVRQVIDRLTEDGVAAVREQAGREETITFALPKELRTPPV